MSSGQPAVRFPWAALVLSFLSSGVGHIYCGRIVKGLVLYAARFLLPLLCIVAAFVQPSNGVFLTLLLLPAVASVLIFFYAAMDAYAIAKRTTSDFTFKEYNRTSLYCLLIVAQMSVLVVLTWGCREYIYEPYLIPTRSMAPSFLAGDRILANKRPLRDDFPCRGDVVVFRTPSSESGRTWIKRVIGVAGDQIVIRGREVEVNGKELEREPVPKESLGQPSGQIKGAVYHESNAGRRYPIVLMDETDEGPAENSGDESAVEEFHVTVPDRSIFLLGDNRDLSRDSRHIGTIHVGDVIGYVDYRYSSATAWSRLGVCRD